MIIRIRIPWAPKTFIFRCYKLVITHILGFKTFIFHGFEVQGYICISPSKFSKKFHLASTKHPKYHKTRTPWNSATLYIPPTENQKKLLIFSPPKSPKKRKKPLRGKILPRFPQAMDHTSPLWHSWWEKETSVFVETLVNIERIRRRCFCPAKSWGPFFEIIFVFIWTNHQFSGWCLLVFRGVLRYT